MLILLYLSSVRLLLRDIRSFPNIFISFLIFLLIAFFELNICKVESSSDGLTLTKKGGKIIFSDGYSENDIVSDRVWDFLNILETDQVKPSRYLLNRT